MKHIIFLLFVILMTSCFTYQSYINVKPQYNVPEGTNSIVLAYEINSIKAIFNKSGVMTTTFDGGFQTEEILIDEGTRAMYKVHEFDEYIRLTAFWGITDKVKSQITMWAGYVAASSVDTDDWDRVIYQNDKTRPKRVFDYAVQILDDNVLKYQFK